MYDSEHCAPVGRTGTFSGHFSIGLPDHGASPNSHCRRRACRDGSRLGLDRRGCARRRGVCAGGRRRTSLRRRRIRRRARPCGRKPHVVHASHPRGYRQASDGGRQHHGPPQEQSCGPVLQSRRRLSADGRDQAVEHFDPRLGRLSEQLHARRHLDQQRPRSRRADFGDDDAPRRLGRAGLLRRQPPHRQRTTTFPPPSAASRAASSTLRPAAGRAKTTSACSAA